MHKGNTCFHCGKPNHDFKNCKYKSYKCKICSKIEHLAICCNKNKDVIGNLDISDTDNVNGLEDLNLFDVISNKHITPELILVEINGKN